MGQFGPTFSSARGVLRFSDSSVYVLGVLSSSAVFVLVLDTAGTRFRGAVGVRGALVAAVLLTCLLIVVDAIRLWGGRVTSLGLLRQTPYGWRLKGPIGVLGWGLDTGLPVSTVRVTSLPVLGVILAATGHAGPFHGLFYGCGVALGVFAGMVSMRPGVRTDRALDDLMQRYAALRPSLLVLAPSGITAAALAVFLLVPL